MYVQQAVSDAYVSAKGARASRTSCSNPIVIRALQPARTEFHPTVGSGSE